MKKSNSKDKEQVRVVVYVSRGMLRQLRSVLALNGKTVSGWFREKIQEVLKEK